VAIGGLASGPVGKLVVGFRPEDISIHDDGQVAATVAVVEPTGPDTYALLDLGHSMMTVRMSGSAQLSPGAAVRVNLPAASMHAFAADGGTRLN
jgi:multiple sugar transport system ATP-binding protein